MTSKKKPTAKAAKKTVSTSKTAKKPTKVAPKSPVKAKVPNKAKPVVKAKVAAKPKPAAKSKVVVKPKPVTKGKVAAKPKPVVKATVPDKSKSVVLKGKSLIVKGKSPNLPSKPVSPPPTKAPMNKAPEVKPLVNSPASKIVPSIVPATPRKIAAPKYEPPKSVNKLAEIRKALKAKKVEKPAKPVAMPKIIATTSRKYEPEFTRSVLDQPLNQQTGPTMRYNDAELVEFKELITRKLEAAKKELSYLHGLITRKDEMSGDDTDNRYMTMEDGSLSMEREQLSQMASRQHDFIDKLEKALMRIENKTYGICRVTGKLIDKARLRAVPHATLSIEAKMGMSRNPNMQ